MTPDNKNKETEQCTIPSVRCSDFKDEQLKAFLAGRQLGKENKITEWSEEQCKDIEHSGFEGWFHYHYRYIDKQKKCDMHVVSIITDIKKKPIWTDYYLNNYKWYRKWRKCIWYKHEFTNDALQLSITFVGTWWALYGNINRYSKVVDKEQW